MVQFFVTGFGPFMGVDINPTEQLIEMLNKNPPASHTGRPAYSILGTAVLEVAGETSRSWLSQLYSSAELAVAAAKGPVVVVHLGVDATGTRFKLEQQAVNDATFRCPDQRGWQPQGELIDDHPGCSLSTRLLTDLDVTALAGQLAERQRHDVIVSLDAGRFLCNLTYYLSLLHTQKARQARHSGRPLHALFVHVPPVRCVPLQQQFAFLLDVLAGIAAALAPGREAVHSEAAAEAAAAGAEAAAVAAAAAGLAVARAAGSRGLAGSSEPVAVTVGTP